MKKKFNVNDKVLSSDNIICIISSIEKRDNIFYFNCISLYSSDEDFIEFEALENEIKKL